MFTMTLKEEAKVKSLKVKNKITEKLILKQIIDTDVPYLKFLCSNGL